MAAIDPQGGQKYWFNGLPFPGVKTSVGTGTVKYWFNGLPDDVIFPSGGATFQPAWAMQASHIVGVTNA